jgi:drug/metabolite transporter (DMT)-like permease
MELIAADLIFLASSGSFFLKVLIDGAKLAVDLPRWGVPLLALVLSPIIVWLLMLSAQTYTNTPKANADLALASIVVFGLAVGVTELGRRADARRAEAGLAKTTP